MTDDLEAEVERLRGKRHNLTAEIERLRAALWPEEGSSPAVGDRRSSGRRVSRVQTPEETVSRIMGACLPHLWEGRCVRHHSIIRPDNATCVVAQGAAEFIRARDAEVVAKALRKAAHGLDHARTYRVSDIKALLYGYADRIAREAGELPGAKG